MECENKNFLTAIKIDREIRELYNDCNNDYTKNQIYLLGLFRAKCRQFKFNEKLILYKYGNRYYTERELKRMNNKSDVYGSHIYLTKNISIVKSS